MSHAAVNGPFGPRSRGERLRRAALAIAWVAMLLGTHLPTLAPPPIAGLTTDKLVHTAGYFVLGIALSGWLREWGVAGLARRLSVTVLVLVGYAAADELTQPWVGRTCDAWDFAADTLGVALAAAVHAARTTLRVAKQSGDGKKETPDRSRGL